MNCHLYDYLDITFLLLGVPIGFGSLIVHYKWLVVAVCSVRLGWLSIN
jgi:hypothetical protein